MGMQRFAVVVLAMFIAGFTMADIGELLHVGSDSTAHVDGPSCPDPGDDGAPCGPDCPCTCCPGHRITMSSSCIRPHLVILTARTLVLSYWHDLHPYDVELSVFRPPRA
jgi:hypothetical protein